MQNNKWVILLLTLLVLFLVDLYVYQGITSVFRSFSAVSQQVIGIVYWSFTVIIFAVILFYYYGNPDIWKGSSRGIIFTLIFMNYFSKIFVGLFLITDDVVRLGKWTTGLFSGSSSSTPGQPIPRSEFLVKSGMIVGAVPLISMGYGILSGAHDYRFRRKTIVLPNLPPSFDGIRIGQISDIHSGSFFNKKAVKGGVEMFMNEKPDLIFFTGDLVNNQTSEVRDYQEIFEKLKAPYGVFSTTGNHDYGDYISWESENAKKKNFADLISVHRQMGYDILMDENRMLEINGEKIAIIGIQNWGTGRFPKYGDLSAACQGTDQAPVKLLLSHDPSHWDAQVRPEFNDIDVMFAGHTHGFQFGVEIGNIKWSPAQYFYKQWAGLYQERQQYLYVNRGFGYLGYPGRIGIPPELTIITLKRA